MLDMTDNAKKIAAWLIDGAHSASGPLPIMQELCDRVAAIGVPLSRGEAIIRTLHPEVRGRRFLWEPGSKVTAAELSFEFFADQERRGTPLAAVYAGRKMVRERMNDRGQRNSDLGDRTTDYMAFPLEFTDGSVHVTAWFTEHPEGFTETDITNMAAVIAPLARIAEVWALRRTAANILNTYVGNHAGERILAGQIRRGDAQEIRAAIWLSDMRGFTALADRLPPEILLGLLNRYFDCQVPAILKHGGEVLKFMGDGLLAIFPLAEDGSNADDICVRALSAAREAEANIERANEPLDRDEIELRFGLALHLGQVLYGNIGGGDRLDFTCIGPAVNLAARLEKLSSTLGRSIVASADFARHCPHDLEPLGEFALAGFGKPQTAFGLKETTRRQT
jgi:adenylate cyclase